MSFSSSPLTPFAPDRRRHGRDRSRPRASRREWRGVSRKIFGLACVTVATVSAGITASAVFLNVAASVRTRSTTSRAGWSSNSGCTKLFSIFTGPCASSTIRALAAPDQAVAKGGDQPAPGAAGIRGEIKADIGKINDHPIRVADGEGGDFDLAGRDRRRSGSSSRRPRSGRRARTMPLRWIFGEAAGAGAAATVFGAADTGEAPAPIVRTQKNPQAIRHATKRIRPTPTRTTDAKSYRAVVKGWLPRERGRWRAPFPYV